MKYFVLFFSFFIIQMSIYSTVNAGTSGNPNLCIGIRGNGENLFAHWPALAQITENYGTADVLSGGSSATLTSFLYESITLNPLLSCNSRNNNCKEQRSLEVALLLKSLQGYFDYWANTKELKKFQLLMRESVEIKKKMMEWKKGIEKTSGVSKSLVEGIKLLNMPKFQEFFKIANPEIKLYLESSKNVQMLQYRLSEVYDAITVVALGGFDATNDKRLFFRIGIVDFNDVAKRFGRIADFYAGFTGKNKKHKNEYKKNMTHFLKSCSVESKGKKWREIAHKNGKDKLSRCGVLFHQMLDSFRKQLLLDENNKIVRRHRLDENVGKFSKKKSTGVFPTTAIIKGKSAAKYKKAFASYLEKMDPDFGNDFSIELEDLQFGYWGSSRLLEKAKKKLTQGKYKNDQKSKRMISLGNATWREVLSLSPAEPGLSRLREFSSNKNMISAGGWSDLHPTLFLKSIGCERTVYLTRINGETIFGQGVFKRLLNLETPSWSQIDPKAKGRRKINNNGQASDMSSIWGQFYNIANPRSSYALSIEAADMVWCTDWDQDDIKNGYTKMMDNSYNLSKVYIKRDSSHLFDLKKQLSGKIISESDQELNTAGWQKYTGCIPLNP